MSDEGRNRLFDMHQLLRRQGLPPPIPRALSDLDAVRLKRQEVTFGQKPVHAHICPVLLMQPFLQHLPESLWREGNLGLQALLKVNLRLATTVYLSNAYDSLSSNVTRPVLLFSAVTALSAYEVT